MTLANPGDQRTIVGQAVRLQLTVGGVPASATATFSATGLPAGLSITVGTGLISGTPTMMESRDVQITVRTRTASAKVNLSWAVVPPPVGEVVSVADGYCLDQYKAEVGFLTYMWFDCNKTAAQLWTPSGDGTFRVKGGCLTPVGDSTSSGTQLMYDTCRGAASQIWQVRSDRTIFHPASGKCLTSPRPYETGANARVELQPCSGGQNQQWIVPQSA